MTDPFGVWLYAVTPASADRAGWAALRGVGNAPVHAIEAAGLVAVASWVPLAEFGEQPLTRNLEDLDWLAATALAHDAVVGATARAGVTIPMRLATVYLDDDRVRAMLSDRAEELHSMVERLTGRTEWGLKAYCRPAGDERRPRSSGDAGAGAQRGAGTAYLLRRKKELTASQAADDSAERYAREIHAALSILAIDSKRHRPQDPKLTDRRERMALNASYLVENDRTDEFAAAVAALDDERCGLRLEMTGPWPPYSFTELDEVRV